ncbi:MAG: cupin domain-containing protein [Marinilabiliaceae bacterium]|jgi:quercetin dioxygenase-like cupin family protein|nr:cupin domain-containing protein [Marinilabiliaceae bacterium]
MITKIYRNEPVKDNPHGVDVRKLYDNPAAQIMHITLKPGESLKPHKTPVDAVFYVLEGEPTIHIENDSIAQSADTLIESPANIPHYISNESEKIARILVIKAPRPENKTRIL